ncbi:MAG TPA: MFS transporter, partial [Myxococcales bacterium]|nr:MFS transporter [Myxococcales bacterium]
MSADTADTRNRRSEGLIIFLVGAIQLINILDFVIVMPMGPDLARGVGISTRYVGLIGGSYTLAAALSGLAGLFFLDRFDRRKAVAVAMFGLVVGTAAGGFAWGLGS